jgi:NAD(P)-dependent dehydrogenase (short-subunit alcohol dehydrogenase family)
MAPEGLGIVTNAIGGGRRRGGLGMEPGYSAYAAMKGGLTVLTRYVAKAFGPRGIRANSVAPGPTHTHIGDGAFDRHPEVIPAFVDRTALGRVGQPGDIGAVIAALLSDSPAFGSHGDPWDLEW